MLATRADERTRTADLLITSDNSCVAGVYLGLQFLISRPLSFLCLALCCTVLRYRWCQSGVGRRWNTRRRFLLSPTEKKSLSPPEKAWEKTPGLLVGVVDLLVGVA